MKELVEGNTDAMDAIYHRYEASLRTIILSVLHEEADADDVLHDVFLQLWKNADRYMPEKACMAFS
jgi:RNA polymerase sigma-70 factor (ECF subfamily)